MPMVDIFLLELGGELGGSAMAAEGAGALGAIEGAGALEGAAALEGAGILGASGAGAAGAGGAGITQAGMAADVVGGGAGAGGAGVNAAQVGAQQAAAEGIPNSGYNVEAAKEGIMGRAYPPGTPYSPPMDFGPSVAAPSVAPELSAQQVSNMIAKEQAGAGVTGGGIGDWWKGLSPFEKGMAAYGGTVGAAKLGLFGYGNAPSQFEPYSGPLSKITMSPDFQPRHADPRQFQYTPRRYAGGGPVEAMSNANAVGANTGFPMANLHTAAYATPYQTPISQNVVQGDQDTRVDPYSGEEKLASGGIAGYAGGGVASTMDFYKMMAGQQDNPPEGKTAPKSGGDVGIYYDTDPDTQRLDALTAAQIRLAKMNKRANVQAPSGTRPTPLGQVNMAVGKGDDSKYQEAAQGGIMQAGYAAGGSTLGGYAAGGNPRLLKGPGDGMSDNIPATIGGKQPARLADGEFVVPADVVSHLGNGSTDAGAKKLHHMMDTVRKDRTGRKAQGKQINANKYMPK